MKTRLRKYRLKVTSSVMIYALFIMVIVTILIGVVISTAYYNYLQKLTFQIEKQLQHNVHSGIAILLSNKMVDYAHPRLISLYKEDKDSTYLSKELFGMFDLIRSRSAWKKFSYEKVAFAGGFFARKKTFPALYLTNHYSPLCLVGRSKITGDCYLPQKGVQRGYIDGRSFEGDRFVKGKTEFSEPSLPELKGQYRKNLMEEVKKRYLQPEKYQALNMEDVPDEGLVHSFCVHTEVVYDADAILLRNIKLKNNIVVISEKEVLISKTADLMNVVIYAPNIFIESGFRGAIQCFAADTLFVGSNVSLDFPSAVCLMNHGLSHISQTLKIASGTNISGVVCIDLANNSGAAQPDVYIEKNVQVTGAFYSNVSVQFFGKVQGSLYTNGFYVKRLSGNYINHLLDVEINKDELPSQFVGPDLFVSNTENKIMKWLN